MYTSWLVVSMQKLIFCGFKSRIDGFETIGWSSRKKQHQIVQYPPQSNIDMEWCGKPAARNVYHPSAKKNHYRKKQSIKPYECFIILALLPDQWGLLFSTSDLKIVDIPLIPPGPWVPKPHQKAGVEVPVAVQRVEVAEQEPPAESQWDEFTNGPWGFDIDAIGCHRGHNFFWIFSDIFAFGRIMTSSKKNGRQTGIQISLILKVWIV